MGSAIPATALGGQATFVTIVPGTTMQTTLSAHVVPAETISPVVVGSSTLPLASTQAPTTVPESTLGTTVPARTLTFISSISSATFSSTSSAAAFAPLQSPDRYLGTGALIGVFLFGV